MKNFTKRTNQILLIIILVSCALIGLIGTWVLTNTAMLAIQRVSEISMLSLLAVLPTGFIVSASIGLAFLLNAIWGERMLRLGRILIVSSFILSVLLTGIIHVGMGMWMESQGYDLVDSGRLGKGDHIRTWELKP